MMGTAAETASELLSCACDAPGHHPVCGRDKRDQTYFEGGLLSSVARTGTAEDRTTAFGLEFAVVLRRPRLWPVMAIIDDED